MLEMQRRFSKLRRWGVYYKLFYVGCSRARKNLIVVVDAYKVNGFKEAFMNKMKEIGFSVFCK